MKYSAMSTKFCTFILSPFIRGVYLCKYRVFTFRASKSCRGLCSQAPLEEGDSSVENKIIYNSLKNKLKFGQRKREERLNIKLLKEISSSTKTTSVCLKYLLDDDSGDKESDKNSEQCDNDSKYLVQLPYNLKKPDKDVFIDINNEDLNSSSDYFVDERKIGDNISDLPTYAVKEWMNDYEKYTQPIMEDEDGDDIDPWRNAYGTPDIKMPVSQVPCGGCGALLHCQDHSIPGYLPSEIFKNCKDKDLAKLVCQRCHFLKDFNTALSVSVDPEIYPKLLSKIRNEKALVLLLADMTDLPSSVWPGILDIIGPKRPLFLIGNKIDLLWGDGKGWMEHTLTCLRSCLPKSADVQYTTLISAKTGFGVEELITKLHNIWQYKGDVYLIGCTNVGKSTLFNSLLQSDYCKVKAVDLIQRATTAPWPGTTLNLLKFPILRPQGWRLYLRTMRLQEEQAKRQAEMKLRNIKIRGVKNKEIPQIVGHIGRTFYSKRPKHEINAKDNFALGVTQDNKFGLDPNDPDFAASKWVYDTPGVLHQEQILDLLTTEEVSLTVPKNVIPPRTFNMKEGWTLFVGGLARIDYIKGNKKIKVTIFSSKSLPITIVAQQDSDEIYRQLLGSEYMAVPRGPEERLNIWPGLEKALDASFCGIHNNRSCCDVTLSSAGWVAITPDENEIVKLSFWTPKGRGVHVRDPPLLPHAVRLRGKKMHKLPAYGTSTYVHVNKRLNVSS